MIRGKVKRFLKIEGGNSGLTEDFIYLNQPKNKESEIIVYSSATQENTALRKVDRNAKIKNKHIKKFSGEGIIIARNGKAGNMTYLEDGNYTMNDHAYVIQVRDEYKSQINIKYILNGIRKEIEDCITSDKRGNRTFNKTLLEETTIEFPDLDIQNNLVNEYEKFYKMKKIINSKIENIKKILNTIPKCNLGDLYKIEDVFNLVSEDRRLTEEYIYNHPGTYPVYSAQVNGAYGYIDTYAFEGEILSVVSYGDSGKTTVRNGKLTIGRNACGLLPKEEFKDKISLKFVKYALQAIFINNAKGADLKSLSQETIRATEFFLPDIEEQRKIATEYSKLENILKKLETANEKIQNIAQ